MSHPLSEQFEQADYRVFDSAGKALSTRLDQPNPALAGLLQKHAAGSASLLSAGNPWGREIGAEKNAVLHRQLSAELDALGLQYLQAEGASPDRSWVEACLLILDPAPELTARLAAQFEQLAWVEYDAGGWARLRWAAAGEQQAEETR